jgi:hypothetical protein
MAGIELGNKAERESPTPINEGSPAACTAWQAFIQFCKELHCGEIQQLKIQDGLPVLAEVTKKKVKFT